MGLNAALVAFLVTLLVFIWSWLMKVYSFWSNCGVQTPPFSYIWGHLRTPYFHGKALGDRITLIYNYIKSNNSKHGGFYILYQPWYVPMDLDVLKAILQTDFQHFIDRGGHVIEGDPLTEHLLNLKGKRWKTMRSKLTPAFSSGKMKMMFETLLDCTHSLKTVMDELEGKEVDIKDLLGNLLMILFINEPLESTENFLDAKDQIFLFAGRFTTDVIGSCAFGIECNSLENPENEFRQRGKEIFERPKGTWLIIYEKLLITFPNLMKFLNLTYNTKDSINFFVGITKNTVEYREENGVTRKDLMDILIQLRNKKNIDDEEKLSEDTTKDFSGISIDEMAGQAFLFFEAGFETSATLMTFCMFELAANEDIQDMLRKEIVNVLKKYDGKITYDAIMDMPYLEMVLQGW